MRVLILSHCYMPTPNPRGIRWAAVAEQLAARGHHVDVVCSWQDGRLRRELRGGVHVHRVGGRIAETVRRHLGRADLTSVTEGEPDLRRAQRRSFWRWVHDHTWANAYWPDAAWTWYFSAVACGRRVLGRRRHQVLVSVAPLFTAHLVGRSLKRVFAGVRWVVDSGDPFSFAEGCAANNFRIYRSVNRAAERSVFALADAVSVTTDATRRLYATHFPESGAKIRVIPPLLPPRTAAACGEPFFPRDERLRLLYVGTLYRRLRGPTPLLQLFRRLLDTPVGRRLELHFVGYIHDCGPQFLPFQDLIDRRVFLHGTVPHGRALLAMSEADVLVNLGNRTYFQLPSKVIEYASLCKPILNVIYCERDSSAAALRDYPAVINVLRGRLDTAPDPVAAVARFVAHPPRVDAAATRAWLARFRTPQIVREYEALLTPGPPQAAAV